MSGGVHGGAAVCTVSPRVRHSGGVELRVRAGGQGDPVVLMLHGLGATAEVWDGLVPLLPCAWVAPDLPGHGGSAPLPEYTFAAVADAVADLVDPAGTVVLGHSFGGVVGLHLAGRPGIRKVVGLGIKVAWTPQELARAADMAAREPARFATRDEAVARHLRLSGLDGLVAPDAPAAVAGVVEQDGAWRPALDPRTFGVGDPQVAALVAAAPVPVVLARGEHDAMVSAEQLRVIVPDAVDLPGLGHNAHVEGPAAVADLLGV
jgi:pimeloyl-ACP methyl ester carboxylesterase